eukprot:9596089-Karenia_brevis.AAC.1
MEFDALLLTRIRSMGYLSHRSPGYIMSGLFPRQPYNHHQQNAIFALDKAVDVPYGNTSEG